ncbi:MAG: MFS transporter [Acidobacteriales bacterium]|nr:MFS transporter [Terriglobales bacterium]
MSLKWKIAAMLAVAAALNYADRAAISSVLAPLRQNLSLSDVALGSLGSLFLWSYSIASPISGVLADRYSRSRLLVISLTAWSLVTLGTGFASGLAALLVMRVLLGAFESMYLPAATALLASHHDTSTRGTAMGLHSVGLNFGVVAGGTFAGYLADHFGWRAGFLVLGATGLLVAAAAQRVLKDQPAQRGVSAPVRVPLKEGVRRLAGIPSYLILLVKAMLAGIGIWIFLTWLPLYFRDEFGMNLAAAGFAGTFMLQISTVIGIGSGGWLSDRFATRELRNRMLFQSATYLAAAPFLLLFMNRPGLATVAIAVSLFSLLRGMGQSNENPTLCDVVPAELRSTAIGIMNTCATAAGGAGVLLTGVMKSSLGLATVFAAISILFVVAGLFLLVGYYFFMPRDIARASQGSLTLAR